MTLKTSSLQEFDRVEDRIRQHRQVYGHPILLVEGPADQRVLKQHLENTDIFPADGKTNVIRALNSLSEWGVDAVVGVVDADFDDPIELASFGEMIWPYARRDLEAMLIELGVLSEVLEHQGSPSKLEKQGGSEELVRRLVEIASPVASLRYANSRAGWGLPFDAVRIADKIDSKTLELKVDGYCAALIQRSSGPPAEYCNVVAACKVPVPDNLGPRGRDVLGIAGVALRKVAGTLQAAAAEERVLTGQLHSSAGLALAESAWLDGLKRLIAGFRSA